MRTQPASARSILECVVCCIWALGQASATNGSDARQTGPWRMRRRSAGRGGLRPTSAPRLAKSFEPGGGDATVKGHPNPFKAEHAQFLQERRQKSPAAGARKGAPTGGNAAEVKKLRQRQREHLVLQNLERLEDKHTAARAVQALEEVIGTSTSVEELNRFLRLGFDSKRPLVAPKARQEQLLLLRSIVRQFHSLGGEDTSAATAALKERVMPGAQIYLLPGWAFIIPTAAACRTCWIEPSC
eukprot:s1963_g16.t1